MMPTPLRAITLHPWWAWAITHGDKRIEYRTRPLPVDLIGVPVALHAGASSPGEREPLNWWIECDRIRKARVIGAPIDSWREAGCPSSAFVAVVVFYGHALGDDLPMRWRCAEFVGWRIGERVGPVGSHPGILDPEIPTKSDALTPAFKMRVIAESNLRWVDGEVHRLSAPVPAAGKQGWWKCTEEQREAIARSVEEAT